MFKKPCNPLVLQTPKLWPKEVMEPVGGCDRFRMLVVLTLQPEHFPPSTLTSNHLPSSRGLAVRWLGRDSAPGRDLRLRMEGRG